MLHHGTIRKYTAALLDLFNGVEIQYKDSNGTLLNRVVPLAYTSREKATVLGEYTAEQLSSGNTNVLPRGSLSMSTMAKAEQRVTNKNVKIAQIRTEDTLEWMYNSVPYEFTFELTYMCRGMNEAMMIVEQVAPKFNPTVNIDIWDVSNLDEPTRVPVKLLDIGIEQAEYEEFSSNVVIVSMGLSIVGNLYPPIRTAPKIKEFRTYLNMTLNDQEATRADMMNWTVDQTTDAPIDEKTYTTYVETDPWAGLTPSEDLEPDPLLDSGHQSLLDTIDSTDIIDPINPDGSIDGFWKG